MLKRKTDPELVGLIREKEPSANNGIARILMTIGVLYLIVFILCITHIYVGNDSLAWLSLFSNAILLFIAGAVCIIRKGKDIWIKYMFSIIMLISAFEIHLYTGYKTWLIFALAVVLSIRYFNKNFTIFTGTVAAIFIILSGICNACLYDYIGIMDMNTVRFSSPVILNVDAWLYNAVLEASPDKNILLLDSLRLLILPNLLIISVITGISIYIVTYSHTLLMDSKRKSEEKARLELEISDNKSKIMMSQISPHFLYNTLSAIMAIDGNPDETVEALGEFGKYLRENLDSISETDTVPFTKEMQHVMHYVSLEKLRFKDKINVVWDTEVESFSLPALSLQMLVENAIKHGITTKPDGGTIIITTGENDVEYFVNVSDDGMGFDPDFKINTKEHVGLYNVRHRLEYLCRGSLEVKSEIGKGTSITMHIPKEKMK